MGGLSRLSEDWQHTQNQNETETKQESAWREKQKKNI